MLSFAWNTPPHLPNVRRQYTHVLIRLYKLTPDRTRVALTHDGWGEGEEWDQAFAYFSRARSEVVLPRLKYRFEIGPVDWNDPPRFSE